MGGWIMGVALASALAVSGCSAVENALTVHYEWDGRPLNFRFEGSDEVLVEARSAADQWNSICPGVSISVSRDTGNLPLREVSPSDDNGLAHSSFDPDGRHGGSITILPITIEGDTTGILSSSYTTSLLARLFGSALGRQVTDESSRLMSRFLVYGSHVTPADCPDR